MFNTVNLFGLKD